MAYTVKQLAGISGVSVRTLHFYDEIGLLNPAYVGDNGYRYYEDEQLLILQQILFFRELGLELKNVQAILKQSDFDKLEALRSHRRALVRKKNRMQELIQTIDKTMQRLKGDRHMDDQGLYKGFAPEKQAEYERYLMNRIGADHPAFAESKRNVKGWTKADWEKVLKEWDVICRDLAALFRRKLKADAPEVQAVVARHHAWLKNFWTPDRESYAGLGMGYTELEWRKAFEPYDGEHPKLALFLAKAMKRYAEDHLK